MQLPGKNLLARFAISSLGNTKLNICCANLIISILQVWNSLLSTFIFERHKSDSNWL